MCFLKASSSYNVSTLLGRIDVGVGPDEMAEERALLYSKGGRHEESTVTYLTVTSLCCHLIV